MIKAQKKYEGEIVDTGGRTIYTNSVVLLLVQQAIRDKISLFRADLRNTDFRKAELDYIILNSAYLTESNFTKASLVGASLVNANVNDASFVDAYLCDADFSRAQCNSTNFSGAELICTNFYHAYLWAANFTGAKFYELPEFTGATLKNAIWTNGERIERYYYISRLFGKSILMFNDKLQIHETLYSFDEWEKMDVTDSKYIARSASIKYWQKYKECLINIRKGAL